jgi:hypothetical protein
MELGKEEIKEKNVIAVSIRFYEEEQSNVKKYQIISVIAVLAAIAIGIYIYIDSGACFKNYKEGIFLSFFSGILLMWGYYTYTHMRMNKYLTMYMDKDAMKARMEELGGLDSAPENQSSFLKNFIVWFVIAVIVISIFKYVQQL